MGGGWGVVVVVGVAGVVVVVAGGEGAYSMEQVILDTQSANMKASLSQASNSRRDA